MKQYFLLFWLLIAQPLGASTISLTPNMSNVAVGADAQLDVRVDADVADLYSYQFSFSFDVTMLRANSVTEGTLFSNTGISFFLAPTIDNTLGTITLVSNLLFTAVNGVNGPGSLAVLNFTVLTFGTSTVSFAPDGDLQLYDSNLNSIELTSSNAQITGIASSAGEVPEPGSAWLLAAPVLLMPLRKRLTFLQGR